MDNSYRIVHHAPMPFALQIRRWWLPIWMTLKYFHNTEPAKEYARGHAGGVVEHLGKMWGIKR